MQFGLGFRGVKLAIDLGPDVTPQAIARTLRLVGSRVAAATGQKIREYSDRLAEQTVQKLNNRRKSKPLAGGKR